MRLTEKTPTRKPLLVVEFKPDDPNLQDLVRRVKPYVDAIRLTALKNSGDQNNSQRTAERICLESAMKTRREAQIDVIASIVCRDHPKDDGEILRRLKDSGVDNLLALYGDPNDPPYANSYNFQSSSQLIRWVRDQEKHAGSHSGFCIAVGTDPTSKDIQKQVLALREKKQAGAELMITQPIFQQQQALQYFEALHNSDENTPTLVGLLAPKSEKSLVFLEQRLGVNIPPGVKDRMKEKRPGQGLRIVREVYHALWDHVEGFYIYPWADPDLGVTIPLLKELREQGH